MSVPAGWAITPLGSLGTWGSGGTPNRARRDYFEGGSIPWLVIGDLNDSVVSKASEHITDAGLANSSAKLVPRGTLLVAMYGSIGKLGIAGVPCATNQAIAFCNPYSHVVNRQYLFYALMNAKPLLVSLGQGGTQRNISQGILKSFNVPLAPIREQRRIADKLDALLARADACRGRLDRVPAILKRFRQSVLTAALDGALSEEWRTAQSRDRSDWRQTTIDDVADVGTGSTPLRSNPSFFDQAGTPWVTSAATGSDYIDAAAESVTPAAIAAHRLKIYPPGTLLVAMYGEGKTRGQVSELRIHATINQACAAVRVDESKALTSYVKLALRAQYEQMRALAEGGNQPNLNLSKVKGIELRLPPKTEQVEIVRRVESLLALADAIEAKWQAARAQVERLTPALLAEAFRGELVPQDPSDEPAAELLKRLAAQPAGTPARTRRQRTAA